MQCHSSHPSVPLSRCPSVPLSLCPSVTSVGFTRSPRTLLLPYHFRMSAGASAAAAAAAIQREREEEEQSMTGYTSAELAEGWEFKILRSATSAFRHPQQLQQAIDEEARAGWVLVEKFDNQRLRFKRPASARASDAALRASAPGPAPGGAPGMAGGGGPGGSFDPYRTVYGMSQGRLAALILTSVFGTIALAILIIILATRP